MTNGTQTYDFAEYAHGALAVQLLGSKEGSKYVPGALEVLAGANGLDLGEKALGFIRGTQASQKGIETAANVYGGLFQEKRGAYKPSDLVNWYSPVLDDPDLDQESRDKIKGVLSGSNVKLSTIQEKVAEASHTLDTPESKGLSDEDRDKAKKTLQKYSKIISTLSMLDGYMFEHLRPEAVEAVRRQELKGLAAKL